MQFSALAFDVVTPMGKYVNVQFALWVGAGICLFSVLISIVAAVVDRYGEKKGVVRDAAASDPMRIKDILKFPLTLYILICLCITFYVPFFNFTSNAT